MSEYIKPTSDIFIKYLFGSESNKKLLISFINAVLEDSGFSKISSVELKSPFNIKESVTDKESILDLRATDEDGRHYDIEVQSTGTDHFKNRSLYYWARFYSSQLSGSEFYTELRPAICINLLDFNLFGEKTPLHSCFLLKEKSNPEYILSDHLIIHFLELHKLEEQLSSTKLKHWIKYFKSEGRVDDMNTLLGNDPDIKEAHRIYKEFSQSSELRDLYEAREKWLKDYYGRLEYTEKKARAEGVEEGLQQGIQKGLQQGIQKGLQQGIQEGLQQGMEKGKFEEKKETALKMLQMGLGTDVISKATGLSAELIEQLPENRVEGGLAPSVLSHHRAYGSVPRRFP